MNDVQKKNSTDEKRRIDIDFLIDSKFWIPAFIKSVKPFVSPVEYEHLQTKFELLKFFLAIQTNINDVDRLDYLLRDKTYVLFEEIRNDIGLVGEGIPPKLYTSINEKFDRVQKTLDDIKKSQETIIDHTKSPTLLERISQIAIDNTLGFFIGLGLGVLLSYFSQ